MSLPNHVQQTIDDLRRRRDVTDTTIQALQDLYGALTDAGVPVVTATLTPQAAPSPAADRPAVRQARPSNAPSRTPRVLAALAAGDTTPKQIARRTGIDRAHVQKALADLLSTGRVTKTGVRRAVRYGLQPTR